MEGMPQSTLRTVEEVFNDFKGRCTGLVKALTADVDKFYQQCDPADSVSPYIALRLCDNLLTCIPRAWDYNKPLFVASA